MRILKPENLKWDKRYIIAYIIAIIIAIISGIVLFKICNISNYLYNFANNYVFYAFNFSNGKLFVSHFISELFYIYLVFLICYFTKLKFLTVAVLFIRTIFFCLYTLILIVFFSTEGICVALLIFIPVYVFSVICCIFICENVKLLCMPYCFILPAILALLNSLALIVLLNTLFRFVVVIV